ncbi:MAG: DUF1566 domain-containing protein [Desulfosalsimonas sp.]
MARRFSAENNRVWDRTTGLMWSRDAAPAEFPLTWKEAFGFLEELNLQGFEGHCDWRLPNRRELFSLIRHDRINPALPADHPFENVFPGYYWTATTCARLPDQAWYVHLGGARVYRGMKYASCMVWPVRTPGTSPPAALHTGQKQCFDETGRVIRCGNTVQAVSVCSGTPWPEPRFDADNHIVTDLATGLSWMRQADAGGKMVSWQEAADRIAGINQEAAAGFSDWRLPDIRELESLVDMGTHSPALAGKDLFSHVRDFYWSSTTSLYETRYAWALYLKDGAVGVGFKQNPEFFVWPVRGGP